MNELQLKYGCNPNQKPSRIYMEDGSDLPVTVLSGRPGYINFLDALNGLGHFLHTYVCDGNPIPTFQGEPERMAICDDIDEMTDRLWTSLNENNKISLYVRYINLETGRTENRLVNKNH